MVVLMVSRIVQKWSTCNSNGVIGPVRDTVKPSRIGHTDQKNEKRLEQTGKSVKNPFKYAFDTLIFCSCILIPYIARARVTERNMFLALKNTSLCCSGYSVHCTLYSVQLPV